MTNEDDYRAGVADTKAAIIEALEELPWLYSTVREDLVFVVQRVEVDHV